MKYVHCKTRRYCLYCHTNKINGKKYFGITCQKPERRWQNGHAYTRYFKNAINKYGWDNFTHEIIVDDLSYEDAITLEVEYIEKYNTCYYNANSNGYNATLGGAGPNGYKHSIATKEKFKNRVISPEIRARIGRAVSIANKGRAVSEETIRKIVATRMANDGYKHTDETKLKISNLQKGRPLTEKWKNNISKNHLENPRYNARIVYQIDKKSKEVVCKFDSISEARRKTGINNIGACLSKKQNSAGGYYWSYNLDDFIVPIPKENAGQYKKRPIEQYSKDNRLIACYESIAEAARESGVSKFSIRHVLVGRDLSAGGYVWKYVEENV
jgi:group I intron endonuclease